MTRADRSLRAIPKSVASLVSNQSSGGDSSRPDVGCATTAFRQLDHLAEAGKGRPRRVNIGPPYATCQPLPSNGTVAQAARVLGLRRTTLVEKLRKYSMGNAEVASPVS